MAQLVKYSLLSFPLASAGLGVWQLKRLDWKKGIINDIERQMKQEPLELKAVDSIDELSNDEYRRVRVCGQYDQDPNNQIYLMPRQLVVNDEAAARGRTKLQSNVGVNVVSRFNVDGSDMKILVNRGWLPSKGEESVSTSSHIGLDSAGGPLELTGIVRVSDNRPSYGLKNNESSNEWQIRDVRALAKRLKTDPLFIDAEEDVSRTEGPYGGQTQLHIRNEHLNYAITWFSLAFFTLIMWYTKYGRTNFMTRKTKN